MDNKKLKESVLILCISYTSASVLISLLAFNPKLTMIINNITYLQLFVCNMLISLLMYFTSKIPVESQLAEMLIQFLDVAVVIYGVGGGIFKWMPWKLMYIAEVFIILAVVFLVTYGIMLWQNREVARAINKKIEERTK